MFQHLYALGTALIFSISFTSISWAQTLQTKPDVEIPHGGAILEYPRGRFQENTPPDFFKWSLLRPAHSVSIKIYRTGEDGKFDPQRDLITRYDFLSKIQSATWTRDSFPRGNYAWTIELYDENNHVPTFVDTARFVVETLKHFDLHTVRMGAVVGFARGSYASEDDGVGFSPSLEYDTTPTTYGLVAAGGSDKNVWTVTGYISDFILKGKVTRTLNLQGGYFIRMNEPNKFGTEIYAGPSLRTFQFPRSRSTDGTNVNSENVFVANPGGAILVQKRFDLHVTLFTQLGLDLPVLGDSKIKAGLDSLNYNVRGGLVYGLFWPIGFSGEVQYRTDKATTYDGDDKIKTTLQEWSVVASLLYAF
jgi:hypothetical protein